MNKKKAVSRIFALLVVVCIACSMAVSAFAATVNDAVNNAKTGVVQIVLAYMDDDQDILDVATGTGFLINNSTVITCNHCVTLSNDWLDAIAEVQGKPVRDVKDRLGIYVSVNRDVRIKANVKNASAEMDYAILNLESQLYDRNYLPLRASSTVQATENVYGLGFPAEVSKLQDLPVYTTADVNVVNGQVGKVDRFSFTVMEEKSWGGSGVAFTYQDVDCVAHSAALQGGISGGPLLDEDGNVIGINAAGDENNVNMSVAIDQLIVTLKALGIEYTEAGTPVPAPSTTTTTDPTPAVVDTPAPVSVDKTELSAAITDAQKLESKDYTDETAEAFTKALGDAQNVLSNENATQEQVNSAIAALGQAKLNLVEKKGLPVVPIAIAAVVIVLVVVILLVVVLGGKKKKKSKAPVAPQPMPYSPVGAASPAGFSAAPAVPQNNFSSAANIVGAGETSVLSAGAGETTVLSAGAGETTVLGSNVNMGSLTRKKTGENIKINSANFVIGKELAKVNYCISDNTNVSRTHIRLTNRAGVTYATDLGSTNGTTLNGVRMTPNKETSLAHGDKLSLGDEIFTYNAY